MAEKNKNTSFIKNWETLEEKLPDEESRRILVELVKESGETGYTCGCIIVKNKILKDNCLLEVLENRKYILNKIEEYKR